MATSLMRRSVSRFIAMILVLAATLLVVGGFFTVAIGKEHVCNGLMKATQHGVRAPVLLMDYCKLE